MNTESQRRLPLSKVTDPVSVGEGATCSHTVQPHHSKVAWLHRLQAANINFFLWLKQIAFGFIACVYSNTDWTREPRPSRGQHWPRQQLLYSVFARVKLEGRVANTDYKNNHRFVLLGRSLNRNTRALILPVKDMLPLNWVQTQQTDLKLLEGKFDNWSLWCEQKRIIIETDFPFVCLSTSWRNH